MLSTRASFSTAGAIVALALWTSAAPTMNYPLYEAAWHLTTTTATWIFAVYPIVLVAVLVVFGDISDHIGRRKAILIGLLGELIGVLLFAAARDVVWVLVGRAFMGIGVGLALSPASAAMVEFSPPGREKQASSITTTFSAVGIALAMIVGGGLIQYAPWPLHLNFVVLAAALCAALVASWFLPRHTVAETKQRWRPRPIVIPRGNRLVFVAGALALSSAFFLGALVLPLGAKIAHQLAGSDNALVTGALLSVFAAAVCVTAPTFQRLPLRAIVVIGSALSIAGVWLFALCGQAHSLLLFFVASGVSGIGYSLGFMGGIMMLNKYAAPQHRAGMLSGGYLAGYLSQGIAAPTLGAIVTSLGLNAALLIGATAFSVVFLAGGILAFTVRTPAAQTERERELVEQ